MQEVYQNTYLKILKLLSVRGTRFTTEELARALGTSKRTVYTLFENKRDILDKTIDFIFREIGRTDQDILDNEELPFHEKIRLYFKNIPDNYYIGLLIRYADEFQRYYPDLWDKAESYINSMWDDLIRLVEKGIAAGAIHPVNTVVLRLMLDQTMGKLLDYEFTFHQKISFESGMQAMCDIILFGLIEQQESETDKQ